MQTERFPAPPPFFKNNFNIKQDYFFINKKQKIIAVKKATKTKTADTVGVPLTDQFLFQIVDACFVSSILIN